MDVICASDVPLPMVAHRTVRELVAEVEITASIRPKIERAILHALRLGLIETERLDEELRMERATYAAAVLRSRGEIDADITLDRLVALADRLLPRNPEPAA